MPGAMSSLLTVGWYRSQHPDRDRKVRPFLGGMALWLVLGGAASGQIGPLEDVSPAGPSAKKKLMAREPMKAALTLAGHTANLYTIRFSLDGRRLVTTSDDRTLIVWDAATGEAVRRLRGHTQTVFGVAFSPDGTQVASASGERGSDEKPARPGEVKLWEVATGKELATFQGHPGIVYRVAFRSDGRRLASAGQDQRIKVWDLDTRKEMLTLQGHTAPVYDVAFSPNGQYLVSASGDWFQSKVAGEAKLWDGATGKQVRTFKGHTGPVYSVAYSPDGTQLATSSGDYTVKLWDVATGKELASFAGHTNYVYGVAFSPDGRCLASACSDNAVRIWDRTLPAFPLTFTADRKSVFTVAYSPDGQRLATGGDDKTAKVWDVSALRAEGRTPTSAWGTKDVEALWNDLAGEEAPQVYRALWTLASVPDRTVPFLQERLRHSVKEDPRASGLIAEMDSNSFAVREKAMQELEKLGEAAERALRVALENPPSLEVQRRVEQLLTRIKDQPVSTPEAQRAVRTVQMLEHFGTPEARKLLARLGRGGWGRAAGEEARAALDRLEKRTTAKP